MSKAAVQVLADAEDLTQFGETGVVGPQFPNRLRAHQGEVEMSLILGRQTPLAASLIVTKGWTPTATTRYTLAGTLRRAGFVVKHSPTKSNPLHVSVFAPESPEGPVDWDDELAKRYDECFAGADGGDPDE